MNRSPEYGAGPRAEEALSLADAFTRIDALWTPRIVAQIGDTQVKLARVEGEFDWHCHECEDELFLVHRGRLKLEFRDGSVWLEPGELYLVPAGVEHRPVAPEEVQLVLIEPVGTRNTGDRETPRTVQSEWL